MANLQVKDIDNQLYESLRTLAKQERRSISQEVVYILEKYLSAPKSFEQNSSDELLKLTSPWDEDKSSEEIIAAIRQSRINSNRFGNMNELFD